MADQIRSINGANALIKVRTANGEKIIGYATGVSVTENVIVNRIDVLGQIDSKDIEAIGRTVSGTIGLMRMTPMSTGEGGGAGFQGVLPQHSDADSDITRTQGVMDFFNDGFDLIIQDSAAFSPDDQARVRYTIKGCRPTSHSFALSRGSLMGVNITFEALKMAESDLGTLATASN